MADPESNRPASGGASRRPTGWRAALAATGLVLASPAATWWLVGPNPGNDLGADPTDRPENYDYLFHPPSIDPAVERLVGIGAVVIVAITLVLLVGAVRRGQLDRRWSPVITAMTIAGVVVGLGGRVVTAAVNGANIGGGFVLLFGVPIVLGLIVGSLLWSIQIVRTPSPATD